MNATTQGTDLNALLQAGRHVVESMPDHLGWTGPLRERAVAAAADMPLPHRSQEAWRYTSTAFLDEQTFRPAPRREFDALALGDVEHLLLPDADTLRLVFVNGCLAPQLMSAVLNDAGVHIANLGGSLGAVPAEMRGQLDQLVDRRGLFSALNTALMNDGAMLYLSADSVANRPIEILHIAVGMDEPVIVHPRHLVVLGPGARAQLIERYCALGDSRYFNNALIEIALGDGSELVHQRVQEESLSAQHLSDLHVRQGKDSRYRLAQVTLGGKWSRSELHLTFAGEGAHAELNGLLLAGDRQLDDVHLSVHHAQPNCSSQERFKGIADGQGRLVFDGHIRVEQDAQKTDAALSNDNLMLSRSAEVDTKPQLEIYADDVKCSHGTTVGELDEDMLFYLRSRGIPVQQARQVLCEGFAGEMIAALSHDALRARAARQLAARLAAQ